MTPLHRSTLKRTIVALVFCLAMTAHATTARAQSLGDYLTHYDSGLGVERLDYRSALLGDVPFYYIGLVSGINFALAPIAEHTSVGINPNVHALIDLFMNGEGIGVRAITVPVYATIKYGADAERFKRTTFGATLGIGGQMGWYLKNDSTDFFGGAVAMIEVSAKIGALVKLRYQRSLTDPGLESGLRFGQSGFYLLINNEF